MSDMEQSIVKLFRSKLPQSHNREMWVNETYLEYQRARELWRNDVAVTPKENTLLSLMMSLDDVEFPAEPGSNLELYENYYGSPADYCWTMNISEMFTKSAAAASQPATAWISFPKA